MLYVVGHDKHEAGVVLPYLQVLTLHVMDFTTNYIHGCLNIAKRFDEYIRVLPYLLYLYTDKCVYLTMVVQTEV